MLIGVKEIGMVGDKIKYYCFNKKCNSSIFSSNCVVYKVLLENSSDIQYCKECFQEMISKEELGIKMQLNDILQGEKRYKSIIIDDDPVYHMIVNKLFEHSHTFDKHEHYMDGQEALNFLQENKDEPEALPDIIFVDVNMPKMDAWEFLYEFSALYPLFEKKIDVYVMTSFIQNKYQEKIKNHPYVKGVIAKNFDISFLNSIAV